MTRIVSSRSWFRGASGQGSPVAPCKSVAESVIDDPRPPASGRHASSGDVAHQLHPAHHAVERTGVVQRGVLRAAIVPERHRAVLPMEAAGEFRAMAVFV